MTTFALIPGAGGVAWYWHRVLPLLEHAGHEALAIDLPGDDPHAGLHAYAALVIAAMGQRKDVTLVAQSMGAFTAALVSARVPIRRLVFVNGMIPKPGETAGDWWGNTGWLEARTAAAKRGGYSVEFDLATYFFHDVPSDVVNQGAAHQRMQADIAFTEPASFQAWPDVPVHVVVGRDDRFFPNDFQARVARERLGKGVDEMPGGHLLALSRPRELADRLLGYVQAPAS
jgi:pimeloyl-ACP methyl ester carboxylesterase